jgi:hypothetical protein
MSLSDVIKKGSGMPAPTSLIIGGIGVDTLNKRLYFKAADGTVVPHDINTPAGNIAATTVQGAINELDTEKDNLLNPAFTGRLSTTVDMGVGTVAPRSQLTVSGAGQFVATITDAGEKTGTIQAHSTSSVAGSGGTIQFSSASAGGSTPQWAIKSFLNNGNGNGIGDLVISGRVLTTDTALTEQVRILSSGDIQVKNNISLGGAIASASGNGITFPATAANSTDPNTLDDYEEGVWTPVTSAGMVFTGTPVKTGYYTKVGNLVTVFFMISATTVVTAAATTISGLPFTATTFGIGGMTNTGATVYSSITCAAASLTVVTAIVSVGYLSGSVTYRV